MVTRQTAVLTRTMRSMMITKVAAVAAVAVTREIKVIFTRWRMHPRKSGDFICALDSRQYSRCCLEKVVVFNLNYS